MYMNFIQKLMEAKRRARLMGRPLAKSEVAGITAGYAATASERLARTKGLKLQEKMHTENLAQRKYETQEEIRVAGEARKGEKRQAIGTAAGGVAGWAIGAKIGSVGGPLGMAIGAAAGGILFGGGCIIISACTDPDSYEVNIAREYRDSYLSLHELVGYYALAEKLVPFMQIDGLRNFIKRYLVDRLIDYGEVALGYKSKLRYRSSRYVKRGFLGLCSFIGRLLVGKLEVENVKVLHP